MLFRYGEKRTFFFFNGRYIDVKEVNFFMAELGEFCTRGE